MNARYELFLREIGTQLTVILVACIAILFGLEIGRAVVRREWSFFRQLPGVGICAMFLKNGAEGIIVSATWYSQRQRLDGLEPHYSRVVSLMSGYVAPTALIIGSALLLRVFLPRWVGIKSTVGFALGATMAVAVTHLRFLV